MVLKFCIGKDVGFRVYTHIGFIVVPFWGVPYRILNRNHKKELHLLRWSLWVGLKDSFAVFSGSGSTVDGRNPTLNYGSSGTFLILGNAGFISSTVGQSSREAQVC